MKSEAEIQAEIQIAAVGFGCHLMRNNSGMLMDKGGRPVRFGLGNTSSQHNARIKSSDLIGFTYLNGHAIFTAIECKSEDWRFSKMSTRENAQFAFLQWVEQNGGYAGFATCVNDLRRIIRR